MKTTLVSLLIATALCGATASFGSGSTSTKATATVEFLDPENFTDFKTSSIGGASDAEYLGKELRREINRQAGNILPAGYRVLLRVRDVDLAGEFEPQNGPRFDEVRILKGVYTPKMKIDYSVTDADGNVVASGERNLTDLGYDFRLHVPAADRTLEIESEMVADFFRAIVRETS
jgi:Protein of unknown function (DUF3016)